jgi:hypothetical protein
LLLNYSGFTSKGCEAFVIESERKVEQQPEGGKGEWKNPGADKQHRKRGAKTNLAICLNHNTVLFLL